ncbi:hypothetical protein SAICODRAFT_31272, partial [Saitoella complicata NRRL Y-17804]
MLAVENDLEGGTEVAGSQRVMLRLEEDGGASLVRREDESQCQEQHVRRVGHLVGSAYQEEHGGGSSGSDFEYETVLQPEGDSPCPSVLGITELDESPDDDHGITAAPEEHHSEVFTGSGTVDENESRGLLATTRTFVRLLFGNRLRESSITQRTPPQIVSTALTSSTQPSSPHQTMVRTRESEPVSGETLQKRRRLDLENIVP